jgi:hypothetical protein
VRKLNCSGTHTSRFRPGSIAAKLPMEGGNRRRRTCEGTASGCYSACVRPMNPVTQTVINMISTPARGEVIVRMST